MPLVPLNVKPSDRQLRQFGWIALGMLSLTSLLLMRTAGLPLKAAAGLCGFGAAVFVLSRLSVRCVRPVYIALIVLTFPVGWIVSHAVMAVFYYAVIGVTGLMFRLCRRDPLRRAYDRQAGSYWIRRKKQSDAGQYFRQF